MTDQPIAKNHEDYAPGLKKWLRCRDATAGSDAIKAKGVEYLPALSSHKRDQQILGDGRSRYDAYLKRALWYNMTRRTVVGLGGVATMRLPKTDTSDAAAEEFAKQLVHLRHRLVEEQVVTARCILLVNQNGTAPPFVSLWEAESLVNWRWQYQDGNYRLVMLVLAAKEEVEGATPYEMTTQIVRHGYFLRDGQCLYSKWVLPEKEDIWVEQEEPRPLTVAGGAPLDHIPAILVGATCINEPEIEDPVILDLVDVNLSHYCNSADLEHGRHWTALPTAWATGFSTKDETGQPIEFVVGAESAWITESPGAQAGYLEFTGAGLGHLQIGMESKQAMAAVMGARLLEEQKTAVEAAETIKTRHASERSVLSRVASTASYGLSWALQEMMVFRQPGYVREEGKDVIELSTDFLDKRVSPQELQAFTATLQAGGISWQTYFGLLQGAEIIPASRTIEEESDLIEAGAPKPPTADPIAGDGQDTEDEGEGEGEDGTEDEPEDQPEELAEANADS